LRPEERQPFKERWLGRYIAYGRKPRPARRSAMLLPWRTFCVARWWSPIKRRARRMWQRTCGSGCRRPECGIRIGRRTRGPWRLRE
jgi:hypothetical protein